MGGVQADRGQGMVVFECVGQQDECSTLGQVASQGVVEPAADGWARERGSHIPKGLLVVMVESLSKGNTGKWGWCGGLQTCMNGIHIGSSLHHSRTSTAQRCL